jgi:hypothetical protein
MQFTVTQPLAIDDPQVLRAMTGVEQLTPTQRTEFIRTVYRYVYAYRQTRDPNLLTQLLNSVIAAVSLREDPEYARAIAELDALKAATSHLPPVDVREVLAEPALRRPSDPPVTTCSDDPVNDAHDPWVERAIKVTAQMSPEQRDAFFRSLYRHISTYHQSQDTDPLATFADNVIASVTLHSDPNYAQAVEAFQAARLAPESGATF